MRKMELCPSVFNLYLKQYSISFLLNDIIAGIKIFLMLFPVAFSLAFFCGASPLQGIISCAVAAAIAAIFGGSKYQVSSIALPLCVVTFEIISKYQYKGLLFVAIFASIALILFGLLRMSDVLKHISYAFISAISVYVVLSIIISQTQYLLGINTVNSAQGLLENLGLLKASISKITTTGLMTGLAFLIPLLLIRMFCRGLFAFCIYIVAGSALAYVTDLGLIHKFIDINTIGKEFLSTQTIENIFSIPQGIPSQIFLANTLNYAFAVALVIAAEASFCTNVSGSLTGDRRLQTNMELMSSGLANFASVACGGLLVSPNIPLSIKNISFKSKTVISTITLAGLAFAFIYFNQILLKYIPLYCISSILIVFAISELFNKKISQYFNLRNNDSYIFLFTLIVAIYFGFISAIIVGFILSALFFSKRLINIKDATVHTTKNHDTGAIAFMSNKNGFSTNMAIPDYILNKIEVIQVTNVLFLNIAKVVEESLLAAGKFPSVLIVYFRNVPFLDGEAFASLKQLVKNAAQRECIVMVSGSNGILLDILQQKAESEKEGDVFGYIVPDFKEAIDKTVKRLKV